MLAGLDFAFPGATKLGGVLSSGLRNKRRTLYAWSAPPPQPSGSEHSGASASAASSGGDSNGSSSSGGSSSSDGSNGVASEPQQRGGQQIEVQQQQAQPRSLLGGLFRKALTSLEKKVDAWLAVDEEEQGRQGQRDARPGTPCLERALLCRRGGVCVGQ